MLTPRARVPSRRLLVLLVLLGTLGLNACGSSEAPGGALANGTSGARSSASSPATIPAPPPGSDSTATTSTSTSTAVPSPTTATVGVPASAPSTSTSTTARPGRDPEPNQACAAIDGYLPVGNGRRALVRAPKTSTRRPAVVVLHGYTGTPERIEETSGWTAFTRPKNVIAVYAEGTPVTGGGFAWTTGSARYSASGADDVGYLDALAAVLTAQACADPARILLTGESNGGAMTLVAACDARTRSRFAMFAPVIPAIDAKVVERCGSGPPLALTAVASRLDRTIPYDGVYPQGQIALSGQEQWFLRVAAQRNQCSPTAPTREAIQGAEVIRPSGCAAGLTLVAVADGAHTWPGGPVGTGGLPPGSFGATAYLWDRFTTG